MMNRKIWQKKSSDVITGDAMSWQSPMKHGDEQRLSSYLSKALTATRIVSWLLKWSQNSKIKITRIKVTEPDLEGKFYFRIQMIRSIKRYFLSTLLRVLILKLQRWAYKVWMTKAILGNDERKGAKVTSMWEDQQGSNEVWKDKKPG